ncbi:MAG: hypothetical protein QXS51_03670 [Thermoproteota archaeon]|nr:hypothetical protein [Candidatus Brockarchaeota archaeon]
MNPGRIVGVFLGIVILIAVFILSFGTRGETFFESARWNMENLEEIREIGEPGLIVMAYVIIVSFILLAIAGLVGSFPLGCGVLGIVGLAMLTVGYVLIYKPYGETFSVLDFGAGYFVAWAASIAALAASFWKKSREKQQQTVNITIVNQPQAPPPPPA